MNANSSSEYCLSFKSGNVYIQGQGRPMSIPMEKVKEMTENIAITFLLQLQEDPVGTFLKNISEAFSADILDIIIIVSITLFIVLTITTAALIRTYHRNRNLRSRSERIVEETAKRLHITNVEKAMIDRMSLEIPGGRKRKYLIVTDPHEFNTAAHKMAQNDGSLEMVIAALRLRLGFISYNENQSVHSTADILPDSKVYVVHDKDSFRAKVVLQKLNGLLIETDRNLEGIVETTTVLRVYYLRQSGVFYFDTTPAEIDGSRLLLRHSEKVIKIQRRKYFRKKTKMKAQVSEDPAGKKSYDTTLVDLGGEGATIVNPEGHFSRNDILFLRFHLDNSHRIRQKSVVRRVSLDGRLLHLKFSDVKENEKDRILRYLMR